MFSFNIKLLWDLQEKWFFFVLYKMNLFAAESSVSWFSSLTAIFFICYFREFHGTSTEDNFSFNNFIQKKKELRTKYLKFLLNFRAPTWHLHTKYGVKHLSNNSHIKNHTDLNLGEVVLIYQSSIISEILDMYLLNGYDFFLFWSYDSANQQ